MCLTNYFKQCVLKKIKKVFIIKSQISDDVTDFSEYSWSGSGKQLFRKAPRWRKMSYIHISLLPHHLVYSLPGCPERKNIGNLPRESWLPVVYTYHWAVVSDTRLLFYQFLRTRNNLYRGNHSRNLLCNLSFKDYLTPGIITDFPVMATLVSRLKIRYKWLWLQEYSSKFIIVLGHVCWDQEKLFDVKKWDKELVTLSL
jgi:hypothetical protein